MERIEQYSDYRKFLQDYCKEIKKRFPGFSYRYFCQKAGLKSPSLLREVMEGKRGLSISTIRAFIAGLGLTESNGRYFTALVLFNQAKNSKEKQEYLDQLRGIRRKVTQKVIPLDMYAYYTKWYNPVIRELVCIMDWKGNYETLSKAVNPPIGIREARESIELLLKLGMIKKKPDGKYIQTDPAITTGPETLSLAVRELNRQMAELGERAIREISPSLRDASSLTLGLSQKAYIKAKQEIQEFKHRLVRIADEDSETGKVYTVNVHLFPIGEDPSRKEKQQ